MNDKQKVELAQKEYDNLKSGTVISIDKGKTEIGYVSQVNDKATGEQSFVVTDTYVPPTAPLSERGQVQEITVIYRGSTGLDKTIQQPVDVYRDWVVNNGSMISNVLGQSQGNPPPQLKSSADTLKKAMALYPNAVVSVYGHSLGSMNGQYAVSDLSEVELSRLTGGFFYQGPNIYSTLTITQQYTADTLTALNKLFNYVDPKDLVPIGYGKGKKTVGHLIYVDSKKVDVTSQHMWGGYRYDKSGNILTDLDGERHLAKAMVKQQLATLGDLKKSFLLSGGGTLSSSQEIFLDAAEAQAITQGMQQTIQAKLSELKKRYQDEIENASKLWQSAVSDANFHGQTLSYDEQLSALEAGGVTQASIVENPVSKYEADLAILNAQESKYETLLSQINATIVKQLEHDQVMAQLIRSF